MKTLFRLFVVFGILDVAVALVDYFGGHEFSAKILLGLIVLCIGLIGLLILKAVSKNKPVS